MKHPIATALAGLLLTLALADDASAQRRGGRGGDAGAGRCPECSAPFGRPGRGAFERGARPGIRRFHGRGQRGLESGVERGARPDGGRFGPRGERGGAQRLEGVSPWRREGAQRRGQQPPEGRPRARGGERSGGPAPQARPRRGPRAERLLERARAYDADGDGRLDEAEREALRKELREARQQGARERGGVERAPRGI